MQPIGLPRVHFAETDSTNERARELALKGSPHGTLVTAASQSAGRGRQGRSWSAPAGHSLLCSIIVRDASQLLPITTGVAVADALEVLGFGPSLKWPNDVHLDGRKVAGILAEGRPTEGWAVVGIGINVAVSLEDLPADLQTTAASLDLDPSDVEGVLELLTASLASRLAQSEHEVISSFRERDALLGREVRWSDGVGVGAGIDGSGRLLVDVGGDIVALDAGEVHLGAI